MNVQCGTPGERVLVENKSLRVSRRIGADLLCETNSCTILLELVVYL